MRRNALLFLAKSPARGEVKTRMVPLLGIDGALALHEALLADAVERLVRMRPTADPYLYLTSPTSRAFSIPVRLQEGTDLGERLACAFRERFEAGYLRVCASGIDSPTVPDAVIASAFDLLEGADMVLGPCDDGGYYLIGLGRMERRIFEGILWGGERVFEDTLSKAREAGLAVALLPEFFDVDRPEDLARLHAAVDADPAVAPRSRAFVEARAC